MKTILPLMLGALLCTALACSDDSATKSCPPCGAGLQCNTSTGHCEAVTALDGQADTTVDMGGPPADLRVDNVVTADTRVDTGGPDPCLLDFYADGTDTIGCNGPLPGPQPANSYGGSCTGTVDPGTCTDPNAICFGNPGICTIPCAIAGEEVYISTSTCPTGSRCFNLGNNGYCFPDCNSGADCSTATCDEDGSCTSPD